jgi:hypothetical protein
MKVKQTNTIIRLFSIFLFLYAAFAVKAQIVLTLTPTNGACVSDCKITASATGTTGSVTYSMINYPSAGQNTTPQSSGVFEGLLPGTYTVGVYDATTAGVAVTKNVTVITNYVPLLANTPVVSSNLNNYCSNNGTLNLSFTGGKTPFRIKITDTLTNISQEVTGITNRSYTFDSLTAGDYIFEIEDACGQWLQNAPGKYATIAANANSLSSTIFSSIAFSKSSNSYLQFTDNGNCSNFSIRLYHPDIQIFLNSTTNTLPISSSSYAQIKIRVEYPAYSGTYSSWANIYSLPSFAFTNFNRSQPNGDKYRIQVEHPCSGVITNSPVYTITNPVFASTVEGNATSYCAQDLRIYVNTNTNSMILRDGCGPYMVVLKDSLNVVIGTLYTPASGSGNTEVIFTNIAPGAYSATITGPNGFSQTINRTVTAFSRTINFNVYDGVTGGIHPSSFTRGYNFINCDYQTTGFTVYIYPLIANVPVSFSIAALDTTPEITRPTITHTGNSNYQRLWLDIPWGKYEITVNMGCKTEKKTLTLTQPVTGFTVNSLTIDNSIICGANEIIADAYFHKNGTRITNDNEAYRYWMLIVDGPVKIGNRVMGYSPPNSSSYPSPKISDLPGGTYKILFYPYDIFTSTEIVNGKTVTNYPTTMRSCYEERTVVIPDYTRPIINIPMSGGITCPGTGTTNLTITVLQGSKPPFLYRYKVKGNADNTYTPAGFQSNNVFSGLPKGDYTVQVKDDCGSITTQDIHIFDGTEQFVGIIGEILPGTVCETREVILSVLSIGPVSSYRWEYRQDSFSLWTTLPSTSATYVIASANQSHKGQYRVIIHNGLCYLSSEIAIINVLPPAGIPSITSPNSVICLGGSTTLTAHTSETLPNYQWYKDGQPVGTNSSTYSATAAGSYTVVVTPSLKCPSDTSAAFVVTEQIPAQPLATDLSADAVCKGSNPVIHLATSLAGVTYIAYTTASGSTVAGSVVGTGSAVDMTLTTTPSSNATYYIGATLNTCNSASRTSISVTVVNLPDRPSVSTVPDICAGATFSISVSSPKAGYYYNVYDAQTNGTLLGSSTVGSGIISGLAAPASNTSYYVTAVDNATGCESSSRREVSLTVNPIASASMVTAKDTVICYGKKVTLKVSSSISSATFRWYVSLSATTAFHTGSSYTTSALTVDSTFYVSVSSSKYCETAMTDRKAIKVTVSPQLLPGVIAENQTIIYGQIPNGLTSTTDASGASAYLWQQSANGAAWSNISSATSNIFAPPALTAPMQYRRSVTNTCGTVYSDTVTIVPVKPLSRKYIACPNVPVTIGFNATSGVTYYWYDDTTGGNLIKTESSDTIIRIKNSTGLQTFWAEPRYKDVKLPRYRVDLELSPNCGTTNPTGCSITGTLLFKEDFGGNNPSDTSVKREGISQVKNYTYSLTLGYSGGGYGIYTIAKSSASFYHSAWYKNIDDHTYPNDLTRGYLIGFDAYEAPGQFYEAQIDNLCPGSNLYFSFWIVNLLNISSPPHTPRQIFTLEDTSGNILTQYYTNIPNNADSTWKQYGFEFTVPDGQSSIVLKIINNGAGSNGNDFVMDDIEIHLCAPQVSITPNKSDTAVCAGTQFTLSGTYQDDGTFGNNLSFRWERNTTGNLNVPADWVAIGSTANNSTNGKVNSVYSMNPVQLSDSGYYRLVVSNTANINTYNCRAVSDIIHLRVTKHATTADITAKDTTICFGTSVTLTANAPNVTNPIYKWYKTQTEATPFHTGASYATSALTADTTLYVSVSGTGHCENESGDRKMVKVTVYPELNAGIIGTSSTYCYGAIMPAIFLGTNPSIGGSGNYIYDWQDSTDGNTWSDIGASTQEYSISGTLTQTVYYRRAVTDKSGCGTAYSETITVYPQPVVSIGTKDLCVDITTELSPSTGQWVSNNESVAQIINNSAVKAISPGTATLTYTSVATGCFEVIPITVDSFPVVAHITGEKTVCPGNTIQLSNATPNGVWTSNNNNITFNDPSANPVTVTGNSEGKTYITYTVSNGVCQAKNTYLLKIISAISPTVIIGFPK